MKNLSTWALVLGAAAAIGPGCGGSDDRTSQTSPASGGSAGAGGGATGGQGGAAAAVELSLPQFIGGAATVNPEAFPQVSVRIVTTPAVDALTAKLDDAPLAVTNDGSGWLASIDTAALADGAHELVVGAGASTKKARLRAAKGSVRLTDQSKVGFSLCTSLLLDAAKDRLLLAFLNKQSDTQHAFVARLNGAGERVVDADLVLDTPDAPADRVDVALGDGKLGVLTQVKKTIGGTPTAGVRARIVDVETGQAPADPVDLLDTSAGIPGGQSAIAWDGSQFVAVWQELELPAVVKKIKLARIDPKTGLPGAKLTIATGEDKSNEDGKIDDQQRLSVACNKAVCVVGYSKRKYNSLVQLSAQKTHVAVVDLATMAVGTNAPVLTGDWDIQEDTMLVTAADGSFALTFVGTNTELALNDKDAQKVYFARLAADGASMGKPAPVMSDEGQRYNSEIGAHPDGVAMVWEDQREKDVDLLKGQNRLALNFVKDGKLERDYFFLPRTRIILEPYATATPAGANYSIAWIDERAGGSVLEPKGEVFFDTYWRK